MKTKAHPAATSNHGARVGLCKNVGGVGRHAPRLLRKLRNHTMPLKPEIEVLTPKEAAELLRVSLSWLAKARMRGEGPPYIKFGRSVRYSAAVVQAWMKSRLRFSTSD
jgi:excisionase family DNA binding protein